MHIITIDNYCDPYVDKHCICLPQAIVGINIIASALLENICLRQFAGAC